MPCSQYEMNLQGFEVRWTPSALCHVLHNDFPKRAIFFGSTCCPTGTRSLRNASAVLRRCAKSAMCQWTFNLAFPSRWFHRSEVIGGFYLLVGGFNVVADRCKFPFSQIAWTVLWSECKICTTILTGLWMHHYPYEMHSDHMITMSTWVMTF